MAAENATTRKPILVAESFESPSPASLRACPRSSRSKGHGPVEFFACWDGDQGEESEHRSTIIPSQIGGDVFWFEEKQFLIVEPSEEEGSAWLPFQS